MADINDLMVRIDATTEQLRRELKRAEQGTESTTRRMDRSLGRVDRSFDRLGRMARSARVAVGALFGAVIVRQASRFAGQMLDNADSIGKAAQTAQATTAQIQELRFAFSQLAGATDNELDQALRRLNRRLGLAREGSKTYADAFAELGVRLSVDTPEAIERTLVALSRMENGATRAALASEVFGEDAGPKLAGALEGGIDAVYRLREQLRASGGVISDEQIESAEAFNDQMDLLGRQFTAETTSAVMRHTEELEALAEALADISVKGIGAAAGISGFLRSLTPPRVTGTRAAAEANPDLTGYDHGAGDVPNVTTMGYVPHVIPGRNARRRGAVPPPSINPSIRYFATPPMPAPSISPSVDFSTERFDETMSEVRALFESTRSEAELLEQQVERVKELSAAGFFERAGLNDQEVLSRLQERLDELDQEAGELGRAVSDAFANQIGGAIDDMFTRGELSLANFTEAFLRDLAQITARLLVIQPLVEAFASGASSLGLPGFSSLGFAQGGSIKVGGSGGPDSQFLPLRVSPGEQVSVSTIGQQSRSGTQIMIVDKRGANAPPVTVERSQFQDREAIRVLIEPEVLSIMGSRGGRAVQRATRSPGAR